MRIHFKHSVIPAIALAFVVATPASAQLLGGSGGGGLTGGLGGGLTGSIERTTGTATGSTTGSLRGEKQVDRRSGRVRGSGQAQGSSNGSITGGSTVLDRNVNSTSGGSASASKSGGIDAQLIGTDAVRGAAQDTLGRGRGALDGARGTAGSAVGSASGMGTGMAGGMANGMASGMASGAMGQLVASGSAAASGAGNFAVEPGMPIEDAKGRTIGYVQSVRQTKQGVVEAVTVESGNRLATLPAASFAGQGDALVTGMTKGEMKSAAKEQDAQGASTPAAQRPVAAQDSPQQSRPAAGNRNRDNSNTKEF